MRGNTITLHMAYGCVAQTGNLWQYDYGQRLIISGVALPSAYEVHFSNAENGASKTAIGNATGVDIPDEYLLTGDRIHVWIYLHDGETDGETEYHGIINVIKRAKPTDMEPTPVQQSEIDQAIAALNAGISTVEEIAEGIPQTIDDALQEAKDSGEFDGADGYSPSASVSKSGTTATITITDKNGTTTAIVSDGQKGDPGNPGAPGAPGVSPSVSVDTITGGHEVTITDASGGHSFNVMDGEKGDPGDPTELIDDSSTAANKAWSASKTSSEVSDLKSASNDTTKNDILPVVQLGYINTGKSGTIDLTPMDTGGEYRHCIIECSEGDQFTISGTGGGQPRLWAFLNSSNVAITKADALVTENKKLITAPAGTAKLIINNSNLSKNSYKGKLICEQVNVLNTSVPQIENFTYPQTENLFDIADYESNCYYDYLGEKQTISSDVFGVSGLIEIDVSKKYVFEGNTTNFSSGSIACVYFDASENFCGYFSPIIGSDELTQQVAGVTVRMPPYNAKYVAFSVSKTDLPNFKFYCAENVGIDHVTQYENQQWNGKTWFAFGTSMSDTSFAMPHNLGGVTGKYPFYLTGLSGLIHYNYALGGSRITDSATADRDTILQKIQGATLTDVDLITIEGFVNDWAHGSPIGDVEDTTDATLYGALNLAIQSITSRNANTTIIILTDSTGKEWTAPGGTVYDNTTLNHKVNGLTQNDYNDAVVNYCNKVGIICIDAGRKSEISQYHPQYIADSLHHSQIGGKQYAFTIWDELKNIHPNRLN